MASILFFGARVVSLKSAALQKPRSVITCKVYPVHLVIRNVGVNRGAMAAMSCDGTCILWTWWFIYNQCFHHSEKKRKIGRRELAISPLYRSRSNCWSRQICYKRHKPLIFFGYRCVVWRNISHRQKYTNNMNFLVPPFAIIFNSLALGK